MTVGRSPRRAVRPRTSRGRTSFPRLPTFRAVVFDVDGLLVDTEPLWDRAETALLARRGVTLTERERLDSVGRSIDASIRLHLERLGQDPDAFDRLRTELIGAVRELFAREVVARPGAHDLVATVRGRRPMAIASSSDGDLVALALRTAGFDLGWFDVVVSGDEVSHPKPAPDLYLLACSRLGVEPAHVVAFEDSVPGARAASAAGVFCIAVPQHRADDEGATAIAADLVLPSLADAVPLVRAALRGAKPSSSHRM